MKTYLIGDEHVGRYAEDIAQRLTALDIEFPVVWCVLGMSGEKIAKEIGDRLPAALSEKLAIIRLNYIKGDNEVQFQDSGDQVFLAEARSVLLIDSSVHSGRSMLEAVRAIESCGPSRILSYTLVLKRGSSFVPSYFGLVIDDTDRALFQLDRYPTNRLFKREPFGVLRKLSEDDAKRDCASLATGVESIDKMTWGDLLYDKIAKGSNVYVYEQSGIICAFLSFKIVSDGVMFIDGVALNKDLHGRGIGGMLLRWCETWARSADCHLVQLWAIENRVGVYEKAGFAATNRKLDLGGGERYIFMQRELLYNIPIDDID